MLSRKDRPWVPGHHGTRAPFPSPLREGWGQGVRAPSLGRTRAPGVNGCFPTPSPQPPPLAPTLRPRGTRSKGLGMKQMPDFVPYCCPAPWRSTKPQRDREEGLGDQGRQQDQGGRLGSLVEWATGHPSSRAHTQRNVPIELDQGSDKVVSPRVPPPDTPSPAPQPTRGGLDWPSGRPTRGRRE